MVCTAEMLWVLGEAKVMCCLHIKLPLLVLDEWRAIDDLPACTQ